MSCQADPEHWTFRYGPVFKQFGDEYQKCCQGAVQFDRKLYLYAITGNTSQTELLEIIDEARRISKLYGYTKIIWVRKRKDKSEHFVEVPITPPYEKSHLDAGIPNI